MKLLVEHNTILVINYKASKVNSQVNSQQQNYQTINTQPPNYQAMNNISNYQAPVVAQRRNDMFSQFYNFTKISCEEFLKKYQTFMEPLESQFNSSRDYPPNNVHQEDADSNDDQQSQSYQSQQNASSNGQQQSYSRIKYEYHPPHPQVLNYIPPPPPPAQNYANYNRRPSNNDDQDDFQTNNEPVLMGRRRMTSGEKKNSRGKRSEEYQSILQELKSKRRLKRKFRHKDRPKKAKSAYNLFVEDVVPRIKGQNPTFGAPDLVRVAAQMYNQLNEQQKRPYQQRYLIDKKRFDRQRQVFFTNHPEMDYRFDAKKNKQPYTPSKSQSSFGNQKSMKQGNGGYYDNQYGRGGYVDSD